MPMLVKDSYLVKLLQLEHDEEGKSLILFTRSCRWSQTLSGACPSVPLLLAYGPPSLPLLQELPGVCAAVEVTGYPLCSSPLHSQPGRTTGCTSQVQGRQGASAGGHRRGKQVRWGAATRCVCFMCECMQPLLKSLLPPLLQGTGHPRS